ncbi:hypothetical protein EC843_101962 [Buttiauxella sp. JUb87]|nr:hypothetical protein EC843_101962 [Buttiauxella sp. JUb87]
MRRSLLYFFVYTFTFLFFFMSPIGHLIAGNDLALAVLWVVISSAIVHVIHFWPTKER